MASKTISRGKKGQASQEELSAPNETAAKATSASGTMTFDADNLEQAKGLAAAFAQMSKQNQKSVIKLHNMSQADVNQLMEFISSSGYQVLLPDHVVQIDATVSKKSGALGGMALGAAVGVVGTGMALATIFIAGLAIPVYGWFVGGAFILGSMALGAVVGHLNSEYSITLTPTAEGIELVKTPVPQKA